MKIILKSLKLTNFKGARNVQINFYENVTSIYGSNGAGKSTLFDAFTWVLFGKDHFGTKDFKIKTVDENENVIPKIDHEVEALLDTGDYEVCLKCIFREKWTTKKGSTEPVFTGHETIYFFDNVPMKQEEYKKKIAKIIDENLFKLITNPYYFNNLKWQDRRDILLKMVSQQTDCEFAAEHPDFKEFTEMFERKTADEIKRETAAKKKKIKAELDTIPARIDEVIKGMPEAENWEELQKEINAKVNFISDIQLQISNANVPSTKNQKIKIKIDELKSAMMEFKNNVCNEYINQKNSISQSINQIKNEISEMIFNKKSCNRKITDINGERRESSDLMEKLRNRIKDLNDKVFDENTTVCPVCGRAYETDKIDEMKKHFEESKIAEFKNLNERGKNLKNGLEDLEAALRKTEGNKRDTEKKIEDLNNVLKQKQEELNSLKTPDLSKYPEYTAMCNEIKKLSSELDKPADASSLVLEKNKAEAELSSLQKRFLKKELISKANQRVEELEQEQKDLAQKCADLDKIEFKIQAFIKAKVENLEAQINSKFQLVKFKLFETQINGAEVECCNTTFRGVPFHDINDEAKLNTGLDIINGLCANYDIYAPVFIDRRESVTKIIDCKSQIINLIVSENDKKLRVEAD